MMKNTPYTTKNKDGSYQELELRLSHINFKYLEFWLETGQL